MIRANTRAFSLFSLALVLLVAAPARGLAAFDFAMLEPLAPGDQYRQLSLLSLVAGGIDPVLLEGLQPVQREQAERAAAGEPAVELALDDFVKPLARIIDQDILLANAAQLFEFARANGPHDADRARQPDPDQYGRRQ